MTDHNPRCRAAFVAAILSLTPVLGAQETPSAMVPPNVNLRRTVTVEVVEKIKNAVVNISTTKLISQRVGLFGDPMLDRFGPGEVIQREAGSLGSGFLVHPDGFVVTNNHVVDRARQITVELADGRKLDAELISTDAEADLAILKIRSDQPLPALALGDSSDLLIGEPVIAVGNPLGFAHSVSTGIVSAVHRDLRDDRDQVLLGDLIQTDAAINPGNSGGPLLNAYGQVIGINTAIRGDAQNIGFAIQVNRLRDLIPELMDPAQVTKVQTGVKLTERRRTSPPANVEAWVEVAGQPQPARVKAINGRTPKNIVDAYASLLRVQVGDPINIELTGGPSLSLKASAVPLPDAMVQARQRLGLSLEPVTPMMAQRLGLPTENGLLVTEVLRNAPAARAGLQPGDVIVQLGRYQVDNLDDLSVLMQHLPERGRVRVGVIRGDRLGYGMLQL